MAKMPARKPGKYTTFQRFAYTPFDQELEKKIWRVPFPKMWMRKLDEFQKKYDLLEKGLPKYLPFRSLNSLLSLTIPTLITAGFQFIKKEDFSNEWRLLLTEVPTQLFGPLTILVRIWIRHHFENDLAQGGENIGEALLELDELLASFSETDFFYTEYKINLSRPELDSRKDRDGERVDGLYYKALPIWLANKFAGKTFRLGDFDFQLFHTQKPSQRELGVELMSWPPLQLGKGFMSLVLDFEIETLPEKNTSPLVYPRWHVRRWIHRSLTSESGRVSLPYGKKVTVYVKGQIPWLAEALGVKEAFTTTSVILKNTDDGILPVWEENFNEILTKAGWPTLESAASFAKRNVNYEIEPILAGVLSGQALKSMSTHYPIGKGLFWRDVQELMEQLHPQLLSLGLAIASESQVNPIKFFGVRGLKENIKVTTPLEELNEITQGQKRQAIEDALPCGNSLTIEIHYQDSETALLLWSEIYKHFGFHQSFVDISPNIFDEPGFSFQTPENRRVRVIARPNKFDQLNTSDAKPASYKVAVQEFAKQLRDEFTIPGSDETTATFVELQNLNRRPSKAEKARDAKDASRYGYALIGRLTQFSEPQIAEGDQSEQATRQNKVKAAVLDMRRQLGYIDTNLSELTKGSQFEAGLQLIGLHLYQRKSTQSTRMRGYQSVSIPVAVRLTVGDRKVEALVPGERGEVQNINWLPYSDAALKIGIRSGLTAFASTESEKKDLPMQFLGRLLSLIENNPSILFVSGNLWRSGGLWEWLQDKNLVDYDKMVANNTTYLPEGAEFAVGNTKAVSGLRVVRYRTDEVPSYLALDRSRVKEEQAGYANGIAQISERIFYSIAPKPSTNQKPYRFRRVGEGRSNDAQIPSLVEAVPVFMQQQDNAIDLVKIFHMLRAVVPHWKGGLITDPLPNHLAERLVSNYLVMRTLTELENSDQNEEE